MDLTNKSVIYFKYISKKTLNINIKNLILINNFSYVIKSIIKLLNI